VSETELASDQSDHFAELQLVADQRRAAVDAAVPSPVEGPQPQVPVSPQVAERGLEGVAGQLQKAVFAERRDEFHAGVEESELDHEAGPRYGRAGQVHRLAVLHPLHLAGSWRHVYEM